MAGESQPHVLPPSFIAFSAQGCHMMAGLFVIFGVMARKFFHWALIVGMVVYSLDGLLLLYT
jgi:hypothetical protein